MAAYCVYCCSSPLFLSSVLMAHLSKALDIFHLEHADGCGRSYENVIQTYVRTAAVCAIPVIVCSAMSYFMVMTSHDLWKFLLVTIISLVLNQTWIAVYMMVICAHPGIAHRICPMVSAIGGFAGGFLVPRPAMPYGYNFLFYINPQFYGYAAITKVLLQNVRLKCEYESTLNCVSTDGNAVLARFGFDIINIYENLVILLGMTVLSLILSWLFLEAKYVNTRFFTRTSNAFEAEKEELEASIVPLRDTPPGLRMASRRRSTLRLVTEDNGLHTVVLPGKDGINMAERDEENNQQGNKQRSSRRERWQSSKRRAEDRRSSIMRGMKNVRRSLSSESQEMEIRRPRRSISFPIVEDIGHVQKSSRRCMSMDNPRVCCYSELQDDNLEVFKSEQSLACRENNQLKTEDRQRSEEHGGLKKDDHDVNEDMADCCVELEDITSKQREDQINKKKKPDSERTNLFMEATFHATAFRSKVELILKRDETNYIFYRGSKVTYLTIFATGCVIFFKLSSQLSGAIRSYQEPP
ncbi:hypothetical protein OS493_033703 [Desmophyllum pertusum]|uniref:ABC-2 type transporter transmembrane domain-containing protein n=1 Tax=Desmophyllum pertusum TaxID=174260 RepID=A0A9X0D0G7_9CNID|nr:hypothetical protein OS493_033703 [Desmophyllum pertusum]